jgi:hypothetical protein
MCSYNELMTDGKLFKETSMEFFVVQEVFDMSYKIMTVPIPLLIPFFHTSVSNK